MIRYTYTPSGQKITQQLVDADGRVSTRRDYAGSFVYVNNELAWVNIPHGRMVNKNHGTGLQESFAKEFHLRDHLGNTRATYQGSNLTSQSDYYPFGLAFYDGASQGTSSLTQNRYLYNGKELQEDFGLNWYDYGARFYDSQIARWHSVDPLAEKYYSWTPYQYVRGNPILRIDPNGMYDAEAWEKKNREEMELIKQQDMALMGWPRDFNYGGSSSGKVNDELPPALVEEKKEEEAAENQTGKNDKADDVVDEVAFGAGLFTTMVSEAARGINCPVVKTIGRTAGALGGVVGAIDNTVQAANAFSEGNYVEGIYQTVQAIGYVGGTGMLFSPLAPAGAIILGVNAAIDVGEYFYENW